MSVTAYKDWKSQLPESNLVNGCFGDNKLEVLVKIKTTTPTWLILFRSINWFKLNSVLFRLVSVKVLQFNFVVASD